jgi:hypothetical protein
VGLTLEVDSTHSTITSRVPVTARFGGSLNCIQFWLILATFLTRIQYNKAKGADSSVYKSALVVRDD